MRSSAALKSVRPEVNAAEEDREQRLALYNVSWRQYTTLRRLLDDMAGLRITYLEGVLELMSPSHEHERVKKMTARLLEAYAEEADVPLNGFGSTTFRKKAKERGLEPDECYYVGSRKKVPDIAIEVVISSGGIGRLAVYEGLGVPEVWFWQDGRYRIWHLEALGYREHARSKFLTGLDPAQLVRYLRREDQTAAVREFRKTVRVR